MSEQLDTLHNIPRHCEANCSSPAELLNHDCFCKTLNRDVLDAILRSDDINQDVLLTHPQLFSNTTVFISPAQLLQMRDIIRALERVVNLPRYIDAVLNRAPDIAAFNPRTHGVFMGVDFHLSERGPQIIEVNTNAGGAFLNAILARAQTQCCQASGGLLQPLSKSLDQEFMDMFFNEWKSQRGDAPLHRIAIVDENPTQQFLYPEFKIAKRLFERNGLDAVIVDPSELVLVGDQLFFNGKQIDMVYNRLTDFSLRGENLKALRHSYESGSVVLTPNPRHYAIYADKRNLVMLSDTEQLNAMGANGSDIALLQQSIPKTQSVSLQNADLLWANRKQLFFKPACGFGSRATYRGDKLTKRVWEEILQSDYVAQETVPPSERGIVVETEKSALKMDIRAYVYRGEIQLLAARLYQGQTTNFRTQGGGFAPVFVTNQ